MISNQSLEMDVISSAIWDFQARIELFQSIKPQHFEFDEHHKIWMILLGLPRDFDYEDTLITFRELPRLKDTIDRCIALSRNGFSGRMMAMDLLKIYKQRELERAVRKSLDCPDPVDSKIRQLMQSLDTIQSNVVEDTDYSVIALERERIQDYESPAVPAFKTHFPLLDSMIDGFPIGGVTIIAARPFSGKTTFMRNLCINQIQSHTPFAVFSLEESRRKFYDKLVCCSAQVGYMDYARRNISPAQAKCIQDAVNQTVKHGILPIEAGSFNVEKLKDKIRYFHTRYGIKLYFLDYLGRILPNEKHNDLYSRYGTIANEISALAQELDVAIVSLAQLGRGAAFNPQIPPNFSQCAESGKIEQNADVILLLHRPYDRGQKIPNKTDIIVAKNRDFGLEATVRFEFKTGRYVEEHILSESQREQQHKEPPRNYYEKPEEEL